MAQVQITVAVRVVVDVVAVGKEKNKMVITSTSMGIGAKFTAALSSDLPSSVDDSLIVLYVVVKRCK